MPDVKADLVDFLESNLSSTVDSATLTVSAGDTETIAAGEKLEYQKVDCDGTLDVDGRLQVVEDRTVSVPFDRKDDVDFADYDSQRDYPEVAVVSRDPITNRGGVTGATGVDPGGGGPIQDVIYLVQVDCWGGPEDDDTYQNNGSHPDTVAVELAEEVADICRVGDDGAPSGYNWIMADPPEEADDTEQNPTEHREIVQVRMKYTYGP